MSSAQTSLFAALPDALATDLAAMARPVALRADQVLFLAGDPGDGCYRVEMGLLKVSLVSAAGNERILAVLGAGAMVGELAILDGRSRSATVTAVRDAKLSFFPRAAFEDFASRRPEVYRHLTAILATRLRDANTSVASASFLTLKGRVARVLLDLADAFGHGVGPGRTLVRQKVSQGDIAAMAGIARENASRILNAWMKDGTVTRLSGYYCLEKRAALESEASM